LTTSITAKTVALALEELHEAAAAGADVIELRLDFLEQFEPTTDLPALLAATGLPAIVTYRASWEGGKYTGSEDERLRALWLAVELGAAFVDVELKAAARFFAASPQGWDRGATRTRIVVSSHNYTETPSLDDLCALHSAMLAAGADIVKIATTATRLVDVARLEALLSQTRDVPTIALGMGEAGLVRTRAQSEASVGFHACMLRCYVRMLRVH
jgi:3-dehydroquinate dehydratase/shikimate dehydrogenase